LQDFLAELKRRNVVRVALSYLAAAWLVIQLVNEIGDILDAPQWLPRLVLVLLTVGFFIAVALSWLFELTNRGIRRTAEVDRDASLKPINRRAFDYFIIGVLLLALGYFVWEARIARRDSPPAADASAPLSVAVLPFRDLSPQGDQAYLADGMAEELLNALSKLRGLRVAGRTSSFAFRDQGLKPDEIARQLGVTHLLEGSVRSSGNRLRVTAQLISASDGFQAWSREFEGSLDDVFAIQDEIAAGVVDGLRLHLEPVAEAAPRLTVPTTNLASYDQYLLGRYHLARRTSEGILSAEQHFEAALERDPEYAPAHAAIATALAVSPYYLRIDEPRAVAARARIHAERAIAIDATNSEAHAALGMIYLVFDRDWPRAAATLARAVELNGNDVTGVNLYGDYLYTIGDYTSAIEYEGRAVELDPLSAVHRHELALVLRLAGRTADALATEEQSVRISPEFRNGWSSLIRMLAEDGETERAREQLARREALLGPASTRWLQAIIALETGDVSEARRLAALVRQDVTEAHQSPTHAAFLYARLGDDAAASELLQQAVQSGDPILVSPLYFFLPEDFPGMPRLEQALDRPELAALYDLRRVQAASGRGRRHGAEPGDLARATGGPDSRSR
jgi:TolB-like protein/Tfp pilus assembly protein PilF